MSEALIRLDGVAVSFNGQAVLDEVCLLYTSRCV